MLDFLHRLLSAPGIAPHGYCLLWRPELIWTHVIADAAIGLAYFSIPIALAVFLVRRRDMVFSGVIWLFAAFIILCGLTHFFSIWTLWNADYGAEALLKIVTALVSVATAVMLWPLIPRALALPSPAALARANDALVALVRERDDAFARLEAETAERVKAEEMLRQSQKMEAVGQLTGGMAHDFNNLMTIVLANVDRARRLAPDGDPRLARSLESAAAGAERAALLTNQLLAFARKQPLAAETIAPARLIEGARDLIENALGDRIALDIAVDGDIWPIAVDVPGAHNALLNLAVNARDAMPGGGALAIRAENRAGAGGDQVAITVADTGHGMNEATRARAFEPFFTTKPLGQGTGLGLAQVYGFARQSGGMATIDSVPGAGTTVTLLLPRADLKEEAR